MLRTARDRSDHPCAACRRHAGGARRCGAVSTGRGLAPTPSAARARSPSRSPESARPSCSAPATPTSRRSRSRSRRAITSASPFQDARNLLVFDARLKGAALVGTVRQGATRGSVPGAPGNCDRAHRARASTAAGGRALAVVDDPYGPARLVDLETGGVRALYPGGRAFRDRLRIRDPRADGRHAPASRRPARRLAGARGDAVAAAPARGALPRAAPRSLSGTLTIPAGGGRHPAVAFVHGSGPTERAYLPDLQALLLRHGVAVLAYDKRGIGQSGGQYPGESPTASTHRRPRPRRRRRRAVPPHAAGDRPSARRPRRAQPGGLDHAARRLTRARRSASSSIFSGRP